jgi:hypothetical protein
MPRKKRIKQVSNPSEKYYRYEFSDGMGIWRSTLAEMREELYSYICEIGNNLPTPGCERNGKDFWDVCNYHEDGVFWFTAKGYEKYKEHLDIISTHPSVITRIAKNLNIYWAGASGLQVYASAEAEDINYPTKGEGWEAINVEDVPEYDGSVASLKRKA